MSEPVPAGEYVKLHLITDPGYYEFYGTNGHKGSSVRAHFGESDDPEYPVTGTTVRFSIRGRDSVIASGGGGE